MKGKKKLNFFSHGLKKKKKTLKLDQFCKI